MIFTKDDLRTMREHLAPLLVVEPRPLTAEQKVKLGHVIEKIDRAIEQSANRIERGRKLFEWRIPTEHAPTMNEWGAWPTWRRARCRRALEDALRAIIASTPGADLCGAQRMRWVRVTRFTLQPKNVDDAAADQIGGKMPIDVMVRMGVLAGDSPKYLRREAHSMKTVRGNAHVLVECFEVAAEEVPCDPPHDAPIKHVTYELGAMTKAILGGGS